jgi:hypothetical protein
MSSPDNKHVKLGVVWHCFYLSENGGLFTDSGVIRAELPSLRSLRVVVRRRLGFPSLRDGKLTKNPHRKLLFRFHNGQIREGGVKLGRLHNEQIR